MHVKGLLSRLEKEANVTVAQERRYPDGSRELILESHLAFFPRVSEHVWYVLALEPNQDFVEEEEIEAILRRFWHSEIDISSWLENPADEKIM